MTRLSVVVAITSSLLACSLMTSLDDLRGGATSGDGSAQDSSSTSDSGGSDAAAGNLVGNGSFDEGQGGCGPSWGNGYNMTFTRVSPGRTGPYACEVCIDTNATGSFGLDSTLTIPIDAGSYYTEAWLMTPEGGVATQNGVGVIVTYDVEAGISGCAGVGNICQGSFSVLPETWTKSTALFVANGPGTAQIQIHAFGATPSSCFIVDDVAFYAQ